MANKVDPIQTDVQVTSQDGKATPFFLRQWNALIKLANDTATALATAIAAQTTANGKVSKSGDTMTGALIDTVGIKAGAGATQTLASNLQFIVEGAASAPVNALFAASNGNCQLQTRRCSPDGLAASFFVVKGRGSLASPGQVLATDTVGSFTFGAYDNTAVVRAIATLTCVAVSNTTSTSAEGALVLSATPSGAVSVSEVARVTVASGLQMYGTNIVIDANRSFQLRNYATGSLPATPATNGLLAYDSTVGNPVYSKGGAWVNIGTGGGGGGGSKYMAMDRLDVHTGTTFSVGNWGGRSIVVDQTTTLTRVQFVATAAAATAQIRAIIYSNNAGVPNAVLAQSAVVTGVTVGLNTLTLSSGLSVTEGDIIFIGIQISVASMIVATGSGQGTAFFGTVGNTVQNPAPATTFTNQGWSSMWCAQ